MEAWKNFLLKATHSFIQLVILFSHLTYTSCEYSIDAQTLLICAELEPAWSQSFMIFTLPAARCYGNSKPHMIRLAGSSRERLHGAGRIWNKLMDRIPAVKMRRGELSQQKY